MTLEEVGYHLVEPLDHAVSVDAFLAAFPGASEDGGVFVLDGEHGRRGAACSNATFAFMGAEPIVELRATRADDHDARGGIRLDARRRALARVEVTTRGRADSPSRIVFEDVDPFTTLRSVFERYARIFEAAERAPESNGSPLALPFRAGFVGYFGYECNAFLERLAASRRASPGMPDMAFALHRWVVVSVRSPFGGERQSYLSVLGIGETPAAARADALAVRDRLRRDLRPSTIDRHTHAPRSSQRRRVVEVEEALPRPSYLSRVQEAKSAIEAGDVFEVCLTNAVRASFPRTSAAALFRALRESNPAPFAALLDLEEGAVVSSSPERFLSLDARTRIAQSRPIKGTRARGSTDEEDARLVSELASSEKDLSENAMIVDLTRNDLGRVCRFGTVHAPELYAVESFATVHQLVSTVEGELLEDKDWVDLVKAAFPPGSMTGAPKIEAMRILERLEPVERGVYSGALGWIDLGGGMDLSVVIRTVVLREGVATMSTGGAVVADSDPAAEHDESVAKVRVILETLGSMGTARGRDDPEVESQP
jgi:para-aminobenzoate synthetase component I